MPSDREPRIAGAYRVSVTPADVGLRVSLRRVLDGGGVGDVVGVLLSWTDGTLTVRNRHGEVVPVRESALLAGKVVAG